MIGGAGTGGAASIMRGVPESVRCGSAVTTIMGRVSATPRLWRSINIQCCASPIIGMTHKRKRGLCLREVLAKDGQRLQV